MAYLCALSMLAGLAQYRTVPLSAFAGLNEEAWVVIYALRLTSLQMHLHIAMQGGSDT